MWAERRSHLNRVVIPVAAMVLVGLLLASLLGTGSDQRHLWVVVLQVMGVALIRFPDVFIGVFQSGIYGELGYTPYGSYIRFLPILPLLAAVAYLARRWTKLPRLAPNGMILSQLVFVALLALGLSYTSNIEQGYTLLWRFSYYNVFLCALPMVFHDDLASLRRIVYGFGVSNVVIGLSSVLAFERVWKGDVALYNQVVWFDERALGSGTILLLWLLLTKKRSGVVSFPLAILCAVCFLSLVLLGRRGILLGTILAAVTCLFLLSRLSLGTLVMIGLLVLMLFSSYAIVPERYRERSFDIASYVDPSSSVQARLKIYQNALERLRESPVLGYGTGSAYDNPVVGFVPYPHNMFLEVGYQLGVVGVLVLVLFLLTVVMCAARVLTNPSFGENRRCLGVLLLCWFVVYFVPAQLSYDLIISQNMWLIAGLIGALAQSPASGSQPARQQTK